MLNEDVRFVALGIDANDEDELIDTGETAMLGDTAFGKFVVDACDNWAWFEISPPPIMNIVD